VVTPEFGQNWEKTGVARENIEDKERFYMKKTLIVSIAIAVAFTLSTTACSKSGGGKSINSAKALKEYLDSQPANRPDKPIKVAMKANDLMLEEIVEAIMEANKYVSLNFTGNALTTIPRGAFEDCLTLAGITIPNSVTNIGDGAFSDCTNLARITLGSGNPNYASQDGILYNKAKTEIVCIPKGISGKVTMPDSVTSIGYGAFAGCTGLTSVSIGNSVTSIGEGAFYDCAGLTTINVDTGNTAYSSQNGVLFNKDKTVLIQYPIGKTGAFTIPSNVTSIGDSAFGDCENLASVSIPNGVTSIGEWAFGGCTSLTGVTFQGTIPESGLKYAFQGDLREKHLAGGPGTYTTTTPVEWESVWTKQ
jgi:hypothetical protein